MKTPKNYVLSVDSYYHTIEQKIIECLETLYSLPNDNLSKTIKKDLETEILFYETLLLTLGYKKSKVWNCYIPISFSSQKKYFTELKNFQNYQTLPQQEKDHISQSLKNAEMKTCQDNGSFQIRFGPSNYSQEYYQKIKDFLKKRSVSNFEERYCIKTSKGFITVVLKNDQTENNQFLFGYTSLEEKNTESKEIFYHFLEKIKKGIKKKKP